MTPMRRLQHALDQTVTMLMATVMAIKHGVDWTESDPGADATHKAFVEAMLPVEDGHFTTGITTACETAIGLLNPNVIGRVTAIMRELTEEDRLAIINHFCKFCGGDNPQCTCMKCE